MTGTFNGYHVWLGIPPHEQPPNYYRLLGITVFETDLDVIDHAADRQMAHVRTFQSGRNAALSQQILNELAAARLCLLSPDKKAAYDEPLRAKLDSALKATPVPVGKALPVARPVSPTTGGPIPSAVPVSQPRASAATPDSGAAARKAADELALGFDPLAEDTMPDFHLRPRRRLYRRGRPWNREITLVFVVALAVVTFLGLYWFYKLAASSNWMEYLDFSDQSEVPISAPLEPVSTPGDSNRATPPAEPPRPAKANPKSF